MAKTRVDLLHLLEDWDWLGITPNASERIGGGIEVPALAASLTLNMRS